MRSEASQKPSLRAVGYDIEREHKAGIQKEPQAIYKVPVDAEHLYTQAGDGICFKQKLCIGIGLHGIGAIQEVQQEGHAYEQVCEVQAGYKIEIRAGNLAAKADALMEQLRPTHELEACEGQPEGRCDEEGLTVGSVIVALIGVAHLHDGVAGGQDDNGIGVKDGRQAEVIPHGAGGGGKIAAYQCQEGRRDTQYDEPGHDPDRVVA